MSDATWLELIGDNLFVVVTLAATIAIVLYLWAKFRDKSRSRYKS